MADGTKGSEVSKGCHTALLYAVQARLRKPLDTPLRLHDNFIIDGQWREVSFVNGSMGVPNDSGDYERLIGRKLYEFEAAVALAAWTRAHPSFHVRFAIETRLVRYKLEASYTVEQTGVSKATDNEFFERNELFTDETSEIVSTAQKG